ncbi:hypothetical protein RB196_08525 [Streptomyces sp. PmtA]|uniref:hypothetical protein n=1 Tax=Streptomyces sp. PmtA TaxID=3074275 RepID=UPI003014BF26
MVLPLLVILAVKHEDAEFWLHGANGLICAAHIALRAAEWRRTRPPGHGETSLRPAYEEVVARVAELDEPDRTAVRADLGLALERLADAGVISRSRLDEVRPAPLGSPARRLRALERSPARQAR